MIPAILSVIYVIYLYQTSNQTDEPFDAATSVDNKPTITPESLSARMEQIQTRLERLAKRSET